MYKILNKLFGWDYVFWGHIAAGTHGISRILKLPDGNYYICRHGYAYDDLNTQYELRLTYLTCDPSKYAKNKKDKE